MKEYLNDLAFLAAMVLFAIGLYFVVSVEHDKAQTRTIQVPAVLTMPIIK